MFLSFSTAIAQDPNIIDYEGTVLEAESRKDTKSTVKINLSLDNVFTINEYNADNELSSTTIYSLTSVTEDETVMGDLILDFRIAEDENVIVSVLYHDEWTADILGFTNTFEISESGSIKHVYAVTELPAE